MQGEKFRTLKNIFEKNEKLEVKNEKGEIPNEYPRRSPLPKYGRGARKRGKKFVFERDKNQPRILDLWERKKNDPEELPNKD